MSDENARKKLTDDLASAVLDIDSDRLKQIATVIAKRIRLDSPDGKYRVVITGPAGSGKSTLAPLLGKELEIPSFDMDDNVIGGYTPDLAEYGVRLLAAWNALWDKLPSKTGWIVEHVEACNQHMLEMFKPTWAILLRPDVNHLKLVAEVRDNIAGEPGSGRTRRSMDTAIRSTQAFEKAPGVLLLSGKGWELKRLLKES